MKKTFLRALLAGTALAGCYVLLRGGLRAKNAANLLFFWADGTSMAGILLILAAGAMALSRKGLLDIFAYALFQARFLLLRRKSEEYMGYHDFKLLREHGKAPLLAVVLAGIAFLAVGGVLTLLFYRTRG